MKLRVSLKDTIREDDGRLETFGDKPCGMFKGFEVPWSDSCCGLDG